MSRHTVPINTHHPVHQTTTSCYQALVLLTCYQQLLSLVGEVDGIDTARVSHDILRVELVGFGQSFAHVLLFVMVRPCSGGHAIQLQTLQNIGRERTVLRVLQGVKTAHWLLGSR